MKLVVHTENDERREFLIGDGYLYKTWYWSDNLNVLGAGNLVIKQWCHPGCRLEIPRERISFLRIYTNEHTRFEDDRGLEGYNRKPIVCQPCMHACPIGEDQATVTDHRDESGA